MIRKILAYSVHLLTASGLVWGYLAIHAMAAGEWRKVLMLMVLTILIDGFDGTLARLADVKNYAGIIDGALLDNIVDYFNYVVVAVFFIHYAGLVPENFERAISFMIILTSLYQFSQVNAKTMGGEEHFFLGFPDYWNIAVMYMFVMRIDAVWNAALLIIFGILIFVPIKYLYPSRDTRNKKLTMTLTVAYAVVGLWGVWAYPTLPAFVIYFSVVYLSYYLYISLVPRKEKIPNGRI